MREMPISKFKATCLAVLEEVRRTREPVRVTRRGVPMAEVIAPKPADSDSWMGAWRGRGKILGDIVSSVVEPEEWEAIGNPDRVLDPTRKPRRRKR